MIHSYNSFSANLERNIIHYGIGNYEAQTPILVFMLITSSNKPYHLTDTIIKGIAGQVPSLTGYPFDGIEPYRDFKHQNLSWTTKCGSKRTVPTLPANNIQDKA